MAALIAFLTRMWTLFTRYNTFFAEGIKNTLIIAFFSVLLGTVFGTLMAMAPHEQGKAPALPCHRIHRVHTGHPADGSAHVHILRPAHDRHKAARDISWIPNFSRFAAGIVAMSMNSCAYVAEIIRSGIQAVDHGPDRGRKEPGLPAVARP